MCSDLPGHISQTVPLRTLWACLLTLGSAWAGTRVGDEWGVTNERKNNKKVTKTFYAALLEA